MNNQQTPCSIRLLSSDSSRQQDEIAGALQSFAAERLTFTASRPFPSAGAVSLRHEDVLFVGEVLACQAETENTWKVLVQVRQMLNGLESLLNLRRQLLGTEPARPRFRRPEEVQASLLESRQLILAEMA